MSDLVELEHPRKPGVMVRVARAELAGWMARQAEIAASGGAGGAPREAVIIQLPLSRRRIRAPRPKPAKE